MTRLSASPRSHHRHPSTSRWLLWMPALMVGALFYWAVALGMGSLTLVVVSGLSGAGGTTSEAPSADPTGDAPGSPASVNGDEDRADEGKFAAEPSGADEAIVVRLQDDSDENADVDVQDTEDTQDDGQEAVEQAVQVVQPPLEATAVEPRAGI